MNDGCLLLENQAGASSKLVRIESRVSLLLLHRKDMDQRPSCGL